MSEKYPNNDKGIQVFVLVTLFLIGPLAMLVLTGGNSDALLFSCFGGLLLFIVPMVHLSAHQQGNILVMVITGIGAVIFVGSLIDLFVASLI